ncbi:MAG: hypothetical protein RBT34_11475 [Anaerolineaceae bacterium]|jgi:hypothetical protein|nr:hypothetical protein [Anaerolineaceae bacterium]MDY0280574.1 hypothetical protein [Salinivirgaceae bacterium]
MTPTAMPDLSPEAAATLSRKYPGHSPQQVSNANSLPALDPETFHEAFDLLEGYEEMDGFPVLIFPHGFSLVDTFGLSGAYSFMNRLTLIRLIQKTLGLTVFDEVLWETFATIPLVPERIPTMQEFNAHHQQVEDANVS